MTNYERVIQEAIEIFVDFNAVNRDMGLMLRSAWTPIPIMRLMRYKLDGD